MKAKILISLCFALLNCVKVYAEGEQDIKRGQFPYMAFIYYPDETVLDGSGARFLRGAVLIRPDWLVTSAVGPSILTNGPKGFPRKTLLARVGAISIDTNFTLNEDEDEQEREIIQIVRPYNHSATQWWHTDISLMKTLLPFNMTSAVYYTTLNHRSEYVEKTCTILVYAKKYGNWTEERNLIQVTVELLPSSVANCGPNFLHETMACASDSDENKYAVYDPNFCQGNSGGPLVCEGEVMGLQTYINNDCKQPHLYQVLSAWENFISCGTEDKCEEEQCSKICDVANKDPTSSNVSETSTVVEMSITTVTTIDEDVVGTTVSTSGISEMDELHGPTATHQHDTIMSQTQTEETTTDQVTTDLSTLDHSMLDQITTELTFAAQTTTAQTTTVQTTTDMTTTVTVSSESMIANLRRTTECVLPPSTYHRTASSPVIEEFPQKTAWPKERIASSQGNENVSRKTNVEARLHMPRRSLGHTIVKNKKLFFGYLVLTCWYFI